MKIQKIKTTTLRNVGKVVLWVLVAFLILCGIKTIISQSKESQLEGMITKYQESEEMREKTKIGATAFAESFVYEYYTFTGELNSDYMDRVGRYLAKGLDVKNPNAGGTAAETISAQTLNVTFEGEDQLQLDVDILAKVKYTPKTGSSAGITICKDLYLKVPVVASKKSKEGSYAIESLPMMIPAYDKAEAASVEGYAGTEIDKAAKDEIKIVLESFFKAYYEGSDSEVSYYTSEDSNVKKSISGDLSFSKIDRISATLDEASGEFLSDVVLTIVDHGQPLQQRIFLRLEKEKDKYYIEKMSTRTI